MSLNPGFRLGPYEIVSAIGAGGMGEVYRARDTRLDRDVAIKILPASVTGDADRRARFEREAKAVAALSHPNILAIFDTGVADGVAYAVTELLTGETLRDRLSTFSNARGAPPPLARAPALADSLSSRGAAGAALPIRKAIEIAVQIARGLGAAHDKGLVHRDLKPENVFLLGDGQVKILDFGLAKSVDASPVRGGDAETMAVTDAGIVMGTVGYMAPEQVRGESVDARADLFALGAVLYEMLSGQRAFRRDTTAETMTAILKDDPPELMEARAELPSGLDRIVRHALEKNPTERFQTARDVAFALEALSGSGSTRSSAVNVPAPSRRSSTLVLAAAVAITAVVAAIAGWWSHVVPPSPLRKLDLAVDKLETDVDRPPVISPDGTRLVYAANGGLRVRALDSLDAVDLPDTAGATYPSWSPDGRSITYTRTNQLWRSNLDGSKGVALGHVPDDMVGSGGTCWLPDGRILLSGSNNVGLATISDRGGDMTTIIEMNKATEVDFHELSPLPGNGVLFTIHHIKTQRADTIDAWINGTRTTVLQLPGDSIRHAVYSPTGHIVYQRETINPGIWAIRFSVKTMRTEGAPFLIEPGGSWPSLAADGTLAFVRPTTIFPDLVWVDRKGAVSSIDALPQAPAAYLTERFLSVSPDEKRLLLTLQSASNAELWLYEFASRTMKQITRGAGQITGPIWFPDGEHALVSADFDWRSWGLHRVSITNGTVERLSKSDDFQIAGGLDAAGRTTVFAELGRETSIWSLDIDAAGKASAPKRLSSVTGLEFNAAISPDGRWLAYVSYQTGTNELFVRALSGQDAHRVGPGVAPVWTRDGKEIVYRNGDRLLSVKVTPGPTSIALAEPVPFATTPVRDGYSLAFDVAADGRVIMSHTVGRDGIAIVLNWPTELQRIEKAGVGR